MFIFEASCLILFDTCQTKSFEDEHFIQSNSEVSYHQSTLQKLLDRKEKERECTLEYFIKCADPKCCEHKLLIYHEKLFHKNICRKNLKYLARPQPPTFNKDSWMQRKLLFYF